MSGWRDRAYRLGGVLFVGLLLWLWIALVIVGAFEYAPLAAKFIGQSSRILFFHVPMAWTSFVAFIAAGLYSLRYLFGGPQRVCHGYGGENPCAIVLAPLSRNSSGDLNADDESVPTESVSGASYVRIYFDEAGAAWTMDLVKTSLVPAITHTALPL